MLNIVPIGVIGDMNEYEGVCSKCGNLLVIEHMYRCIVCERGVHPDMISRYFIETDRVLCKDCDMEDINAEDNYINGAEYSNK